MPRTAIAQIAKLIGRELESGAGPSEQALATGPMLAEAGATTEIVERLFAEAQRKRPNDLMMQAYAFILEGALETLRLHANGGDVSAEHEIGEVHNRVDHALGQGDFAPEVLMLVARAFARAELDPGRSLQEAMVSAMEARSHLGPTASSAEEISDHCTWASPTQLLQARQIAHREAADAGVEGGKPLVQPIVDVSKADRKLVAGRTHGALH